MREWIKNHIERWKESRRRAVEEDIRQYADRIYNIKEDDDGTVYLILDVGRTYCISDNYQSYGEATELMMRLRNKYYEEQIKKERT